MKSQKKTFNSLLSKISGFLLYHSLRLFGKIPRHNAYRIPVLLERDLEKYLPGGEDIHCMVCQEELTKNDISTMVVIEGSYQFCCKNIGCIDKLRRLDYE